jgi:hypothetical protein
MTRPGQCKGIIYSLVSARLARAQGRIPLTWPVASSKYLTIPLAIVALLISAPSRVEESLVTSKSLTPEIALDLARAALADGQAYRLFSWIFAGADAPALRSIGGIHGVVHEVHIAVCLGPKPNSPGHRLGKCVLQIALTVEIAFNLVA